VDAVELLPGVVAVLADVLLQVLPVLLEGLRAQGVGLSVDGLADFPGKRAWRSQSWRSQSMSREAGKTQDPTPLPQAFGARRIILT